jgi:hypothetical protein
MNEAKCCTPVELLNDMAQEIIDRLDKVTSLTNGIEDKVYGTRPQEACEKNGPPAGLQAKLFCIRSLTKDIGVALEGIHAKL